MSTDPSYTVFVRLPFPRGDFVDPPSVEWDATKDKQLWKILSKASKNSDIDWIALAIKFEVPLAFLLQQAAWLYERQLLQVRAQMRKVGASKSAAPSPVPGSISETATGGESMRRTGSGGGRIQSSLSNGRDSPIPPKNDASVPSTPRVPPPISRTPSQNAVPTTSRPNPQISPRPANATLAQAAKPKPSLLSPQRSPQPEQLSSPESSAASSSSSSPVQSRVFRRPPKFASNKLGQSEDADDDEEDEPAFMPFAAGDKETHHDPSATLRGDPRGVTRRVPGHKKTGTGVSQTSDSSASSTAPVSKRVEAAKRHGPHGGKPGPLSPRRTAELSGRREGSEGSPSMGSSFSDLDDASVTQSALEEALASNMQAGGGMASRMSTISQALKSRYL